jgi:hypothetical protein
VETPVFSLTEYGYNIIDESVTGQVIEIGTTEYVDKVYNSTFRDCCFHILDKKYFPPGNSEFYDCEFRPKTFLQSSISDNYWEDCRFIGDFRSTHFGAATDFNGMPTRWPEIALRGCDFSQAKMQCCVLRRLDIATTKFPVWPCFTVLDPHHNLKAFKSAKLPFNDSLYEYAVDEGVSAIMYNWKITVKKYKFDLALDPEVVREALSKLDFIRL